MTDSAQSPERSDKAGEYIIFGAPHIGEAEIEEVVDCLRSGWLGSGPKVKQFEANFGDYKGVASDAVVAVNSCTAGLHLALKAADLREGAEVITTPLTFCATVNAILHAGYQPVLADVDPETGNIDPEKIESNLSQDTGALLPVHYAGRPCDMDAIMDLASRSGLKVIEDCAHAVEAKHQGRPLGTLGDFGCFSFYVTKNLTTGEGGMVIGKDAEAISRVRTLALHGLSADAWHRFSDSGYRHYAVAEAGFKYNMMDLQAAIGLHQLAALEARWLRRRDLFTRYTQAFHDCPLDCPAATAAGDRHAYHLFTVQLQDDAPLTRDQLLEELHKRGIGAGVHYLSIAEHPYYQQRFGWRPECWPHAMRIGRRTLSLPMSSSVTDAQAERIINMVRELLL